MNRRDAIRATFFGSLASLLPKSWRRAPEPEPEKKVELDLSKVNLEHVIHTEYGDFTCENRAFQRAASPETTIIQHSYADGYDKDKPPKSLGALMAGVAGGFGVFDPKSTGKE